nr:MAG: hypothetical protein [Bee densovirus 4]
MSDIIVEEETLLPWCSNEDSFSFKQLFSQLKDSTKQYAETLFSLYEFLTYLRHLARIGKIVGSLQQLLFQPRVEDSDIHSVNDLATVIWLAFQQSVSPKSSWSVLLKLLSESDSCTTFLSSQNAEDLAAAMDEHWPKYLEDKEANKPAAKSAVSKRKQTSTSKNSYNSAKKLKPAETATEELLLPGECISTQRSLTSMLPMTADSAAAGVDVVSCRDFLLNDDVLDDVGVASCPRKAPPLLQNICFFREREVEDFSLPCDGGSIFARLTIYDHKKINGKEKKLIWRDRTTEMSFCVKNNQASLLNALQVIKKHCIQTICRNPEAERNVKPQPSNNSFGRF